MQSENDNNNYINGASSSSFSSSSQQVDISQSSNGELLQTIRGGPSMIFEMARKCMLDWGNEIGTVEGGSLPPKELPQRQRQRLKPYVLPRWHPHKGISDENPNFRTEAPLMNNQGFARTIWRNVRKRNKPSLWKNALRTYDRMIEIEQLQQQQQQQQELNGQRSSSLIIRRSNIHHEGAMLACAKLGMWERAFDIYKEVFETEVRHDRERKAKEALSKQQQEHNRFNLGIPIKSLAGPKSRRERQQEKLRRICVTDDMVTSMIRACIKASKTKEQPQSQPSSTFVNVTNGVENEQDDIAMRRIPLDKAVTILDAMRDVHDIPVVSLHVNPLAAAYQELGCFEEARELIQTRLSNRTVGEEPEDGVDILNIHDFSAKDKGSYSLLVRGAVASGDWADAVGALGEMTDAGLYPVARHCNTWTEISERRSQHRAVGSWKKKRNDYWIESLQ